MARVYKGGRKRKTGDRLPCGRLIPAVDNGTSDQRLKRDIAAGHRSFPGEGKLHEALLKVEKDNLPSLRTGTDGLDILLARRIIDRDQFETALDFCACWCAYIGRPWPKGWKAERQAPDHDGGISEAQIRRMKIRYWNCLAAMDLADRTLYPLVRDVVIHGKMLGVVEEVLKYDVVRQSCDGGGLIARKYGTVPPGLRVKIGRLTRGIAIIDGSPWGDFSREAEAMISRLKDAAKPLTKY